MTKQEEFSMEDVKESTPKEKPKTEPKPVTGETADKASPAPPQPAIADAGLTLHMVFHREESPETWISATIRSPGVNDGLKELEALLVQMKEHKYTIVNQPRQAGERQFTPPGKPVAPPAPREPQQPAASQPSEPRSNLGTLRLEYISVDYDGKSTDLVVEFGVEKFKYPIRDKRGAEVIAGLFDKELGWTVDHFNEPARYRDLGTLFLDFEKVEKEGKDGKTRTYYNVMRIHA